MEKAKIRIANKWYDVLVAKTEEERERGLMDVEEMDDNEGCLFIHPEVEDVSYWMKDTYIPLDIIFINDDCEVISVKHGKPESLDYISESGVKYVLELNENSGVEPGDILELDEDDDIELEPGKMYIIGSDGKPQGELQGGERIFSRRSSKVILRKAKKAYKSKSDSDYKSLGRYIFGELTAQDSRKPEFVDSPK